MKTSRHNILFIVDDDPDDRQLILDAFLRINSSIDYVFIDSGTELIETLHTTSPENLPGMVLLDLNMPGMLGLQALKEIRADKAYSHIPIIVLTTSSFSQDESSAYKLGANCFVRKPQTFTELTEISAALIRLWLNPVMADPV